MPHLIETHDEFCLRNGSPAFRATRRLTLFPNGARILDLGTGVKQYIEAPADPKAALQSRREYHAAWLTQVESDFRTLRSALLGETHLGLAITWQWKESLYGPPLPTKDGYAALIFLKNLVEQHKDALTQIERHLADLPEARERRERQRLLNEIETERALKVAEEQRLIRAVTL